MRGHVVHFGIRNPTSLNAARRQRELAALAAGEVVDLLVVGLGVTGAGVALDAASRGLSVAAVDAHDMAFGTSRWSSKLVHGGLRYLASGQVGIAHESAVERGLLLTHIAPHLVRPLPFVLPLTPAVSGPQALAAGAGLAAGNLLRVAARTPRRTLPWPRRLSAAKTRELLPGLDSARLRGGLAWWDGQVVDDARLVVAIARTAAGYGARILTHCRAEQLGGDGALLRDTLTGDRLTIKARAVVNATGVWAGELVDGVRLLPSRGTHLVLGHAALGVLGAAATLPVPGERGRYVFTLPQPDGLVYVGLTDEPADGPVPDVPEPTEAEIEFLLGVLNSAFERAVGRDDVLGAYAGLRPLLAGTSQESAGGVRPAAASAVRSADLSRRHAVLMSPDGIVTVVGGKLTTYRRMAEHAVDAAVHRHGLAAGPCRTRRLPLVGAVNRDGGADVGAPARLVRRYGTEAPAVLALAAGAPELLEPIAPGIPTTGAELVWAVRHEGALDAADVLDRRTRIGLVDPDRETAMPAVQAALARS